MFGWLTRDRKTAAPVEARAADAMLPVSGPNFMEFFGLSAASAGEPVTVETALGVPAVFSAVNFLSGALASLPVHVYQRGADGKESRSQNDPLEVVLNEASSDGQSSFDWRKYSFDQTFTGGRQVSFIERNAAGRILSIWPLDPTKLTIERKSGRVRYLYQDGGRTVPYDAVDVIDLPFMLKADGITHRSPITANSEVISMAIAATKYGGSYFRSGGVPPFMVTGDFQTTRGMENAAEDIEASVRKATKEKRQAVVLPRGLDIKTIGTDAEKAQLIETQRFMIEQVARIYALPPVFLQDLTHGTFANTEQQDLHLVKHTLRRWVKQYEGELNLKLFGRLNRSRFVRMNLDALLRGDFKTRMEGYAQAIQHGVMTPNEARSLEGRDAKAGGDMLFIQGATVPIEQAGQGQGGNNGS